MKRVVLAVLIFALSGAAADKPNAQKKAPKNEPARVVDSGTFGVFVGGRRVATEKFEISQRSDSSTAKSEIMALLDNPPKVAQSAELQMAANGDLVRYAWREPDAKQEATVEPNNEFLVQHVLAGGTTTDLPYIMPRNTPILDDYFFSHRELLAWRYLAAGCAPKEGTMECKMAPSSFGVLIPQQHVTTMISLELTGKEKVTVRGAERQLTRMNLKGDGIDWSLWLDDQNKMVRITINGENTEVVRD